MTGETAVALDILERAARIEREERGFYLQASRLAPEETGCRMFEQLAGDEARHLEMIRRHQASLRRGNQWAAHSPAGPGPVNLDRPLFPRSRAVLEQAIATATRGAGTLLFGLDVESRSYDMYREAAAMTADPQGRSVLESLAGEESLHFEILMMRYEFLYGAVAVTAGRPVGVAIREMGQGGGVMTEETCPACSCTVGQEAVEKDGVAYCCEPCADGEPSECATCASPASE